MGRLLVIDDDPLIIDSVRLALAEENHTVGAALSAAEALAAIEQADWDLAFVDVVLPDMDGLQLLRRLLARRPGLHAVVMTGHGSGARGFAARDAGAYAFLEKPHDMTPEKILTAAANALRHKAVQEELERARRQVAMTEKLSTLGTLVSGVAHEIRTPLTYVTNNLFLVRQRLEQAGRKRPELAELIDELVGYGQDAMEGVSRINRLVEDLREVARRDGMGMVAADLRDVVRVAVDLFRATRRGRVEVDAELASVPGLALDTSQIQQVVLNLLVNAAEAMPGGGVVRVLTRPVAGGGEIEVTDTGTGIAPEIQAQLFHPFVTTKPEGTGLGLSICRRITEAHRGRIGYTTAPGKGTVFAVFLPAPVEGTPPAA
jgi:signal transduction histidine kinase